MKLCIKLPTYGRPEQFLSLLPVYYQLLSGEVDYEIVVSCNSDDPTMNCDRIREELSKFPRLSLCFGNFTGKIEACNAHLADREWDILMVTSDDMVPEVFGYDRLIVERMSRFFPDKDGVLHFNDGYTRDTLNTLPILGRRYFERFGYVYHPFYRSLWADNEYLDVARLLDRVAYFDEVIIRHEHHANVGVTPDSVYDRNQVFWDRDRMNYRERKARSFDLSLAPVKGSRTGDTLDKIQLLREEEHLIVVLVGPESNQDVSESKSRFQEAGLPCLVLQGTPSSQSDRSPWYEAIQWAMNHCQSRWLVFVDADVRLQPGAPAAIVAATLDFEEEHVGCMFLENRTPSPYPGPGWQPVHAEALTGVSGLVIPRIVALALSQAGHEVWGNESPPERWACDVGQYLRQRGRVSYVHRPPLLEGIGVPVPKTAAKPDEILLSVLIPTLVSRQVEFQQLAKKLSGQVQNHHLSERVEILSYCDNKEHSVGYKRNALVQQARGRFVAFVDDDDDVDSEYIPLVCSVIAQHPEIDCIGFRGQMTWAGRFPEPMIHSLRYSSMETVGHSAGFNVYVRPPNHLNPMRRDIAQRYRFPNINFGEDSARTEQMVRDGVLRHEYFVTDRILYYYRFDPTRTEASRPSQT
jgi:glycosyltransferase involved in cell wall biosynthesis